MKTTEKKFFTEEVLKRVAEGVWCQKNHGFFSTSQCAFCYVAPDYEGGHDPDCPVTLARRILDEC